jgi:hypothetical protein
MVVVFGYFMLGDIVLGFKSVTNLPYLISAGLIYAASLGVFTVYSFSFLLSGSVVTSLSAIKSLWGSIIKSGALAFLIYAGLFFIPFVDRVLVWLISVQIFIMGACSFFSLFGKLLVHFAGVKVQGGVPFSLILEVFPTFGGHLGFLLLASVVSGLLEWAVLGLMFSLFTFKNPGTERENKVFLLTHFLKYPMGFLGGSMVLSAYISYVWLSLTQLSKGLLP